MVDHSVRAHSTWSASATARNVFCAGALTLAPFAPKQKESIQSARGTACHQISEKALRSGADVETFLGTVEKTKEHDIEIDEELVNSAAEYVGYCRDAMTGDGHWIEERFSLLSLAPPFDAGGTGDFVSYSAVRRNLEVIDLKNGMGVVDVTENPQLRTYGLGALLLHQDLDVETITVTIVQPRAPHKDGRIRSETFHVADLVDWTGDLLTAMNRSKQAMDEYDAVGTNKVLMDEWTAKWLRPGKCTFCPVEGSCPALKRDAMSVAAVWFDDMDQPRLGNSALDTSPEALNRDLNMIPMLEDWIKARRALAHSFAEQGVCFDDHQLADKIGNRKWAGEDEKVAHDLEHVAGLTDEQIFDRKLKSPAQIEKVLGAKRKNLIENMVHRPITGTNLVSKEKTTRPAAKTTAERHFENQ